MTTEQQALLDQFKANKLTAEQYTAKLLALQPKQRKFGDPTPRIIVSEKNRGKVGFGNTYLTGNAYLTIRAGIKKADEQCKRRAAMELIEEKTERTDKAGKPVLDKDGNKIVDTKFWLGDIYAASSREAAERFKTWAMSL